MSKLVTVDEATGVPTAADATVTDILTSLFSTNKAVTGMYGVVQKAGLVVGGHLFANKKHSGSYMNFGTGTYF